MFSLAKLSSRFATHTLPKAFKGPYNRHDRIKTLSSIRFSSTNKQEKHFSNKIAARSFSVLPAAPKFNNGSSSYSVFALLGGLVGLALALYAWGKDKIIPPVHAETNDPVTKSDKRDFITRFFVKLNRVNASISYQMELEGHNEIADEMRVAKSAFSAVRVVDADNSEENVRIEKMVGIASLTDETVSLMGGILGESINLMKGFFVVSNEKSNKPQPNSVNIVIVLEGGRLCPSRVGNWEISSEFGNYSCKMTDQQVNIEFRSLEKEVPPEKLKELEMFNLRVAMHLSTLQHSIAIEPK